MHDIAVSLDNVGLTIAGKGRAVEVLKGITLSVERGETVALTGPSGSGKTSLLMLIGGLERCSGGRVCTLGQDLAALSEDALANFRLRNMGIIFQSFHLIPTMTAISNVAVPLELAGRRGAFDIARAELDAVGLAERANHYPSQLSGGEQQRVAIARASAMRPTLMLADEPTGNLDSVSGERVMDLLFALTSKIATTLILVTHDAELSARCNRQISIRDGGLLAAS